MKKTDIEIQPASDGIVMVMRTHGSGYGRGCERNDVQLDREHATKLRNQIDAALQMPTNVDMSFISDLNEASKNLFPK